MLKGVRLLVQTKGTAKRFDCAPLAHFLLPPAYFGPIYSRSVINMLDEAERNRL